MSYSQDAARELGLSVLLYMTGQPDLIAGFMGRTGLNVGDLRAMATDSDLALHVLDYLTEDDTRVQDAAHALGVPPQDFMVARTSLAGPGSHGWQVD